MSKIFKVFHKNRRTKDGIFLYVNEDKLNDVDEVICEVTKIVEYYLEIRRSMISLINNNSHTTPEKIFQELTIFSESDTAKDQLAHMYMSYGDFYLSHKKMKAHEKRLKTRQSIFKIDDGACVYCGGEVCTDVENDNDKRYTIDHILPLSRGGSNLFHNKVTCCGKCNKLKGNSFFINR